jgi:hypothetical protein
MLLVEPIKSPSTQKGKRGSLFFQLWAKSYRLKVSVGF